MIKQRNFAMLIVLSIITFGIYGLIFWWGYVKDLNKACEGYGKKSPNFIAVIIFSALTFGIYSLYWHFSQAERLQDTAPELVKQGGGIILILLLLGSLAFGIGPIVAQYLMVKNLNIVADKYNRKLGTVS